MIKSIKTYDWFRTKTIGELNKIMERHGCVWCPRCGGRGKDGDATLFRKEKICPRCNGRTIVPARTITDKELPKLSLHEQETIAKYRQYPATRPAIIPPNKSDKQYCQFGILYSEYAKNTPFEKYLNPDSKYANTVICDHTNAPYVIFQNIKDKLHCDYAIRCGKCPIGKIIQLVKKVH